MAATVQPGELSEKSKQNLWNKWPPHPVGNYNNGPPAMGNFPRHIQQNIANEGMHNAVDSIIWKSHVNVMKSHDSTE